VVFAAARTLSALVVEREFLPVALLVLTQADWFDLEKNKGKATALRLPRFNIRLPQAL